MEFLFENPFILIAIIAAISSFFKKAKGQERPRQTPPKPFVENIPTIEVEEHIPQSRQPRALDRQTIQNEYMDAKKQAEAKIAALKEKQQKAAARSERINSVSRLNQSPTDRIVPKEKARDFVVDKEKLGDAIVWSEILGPPRAKKPHRSMNIR